MALTRKQEAVARQLGAIRANVVIASADGDLDGNAIHSESAWQTQEAIKLLVSERAYDEICCAAHAYRNAIIAEEGIEWMYNAYWLRTAA